MSILDFENFVLEYLDFDMKKIKKVLPTSKFKHSKRVAELTRLLNDNPDIYSASVYHDFLERGGEKSDMKKILSPYAVQLVKVLSNEDDSDTLTKLKAGLNNKPQSFIDDILIIKLCDRCDNLKKRVFQNILNKNYVLKSLELIQWIWDNYHGDKSKMKGFIESNILPFVPKLSKKLILES